METFIVFLKGINVGGHKKVPMVQLREFLVKDGFPNVQTYIQSGNIVLQSSYKAPQIENKIEHAIQSHFGFDVSVIVKTREELQAIFDASPFSDEVKEKSYFMMLHEAPDSDLIKEASKKVYEGEEYKIIKDCIYYYCEKGFGQAKFNANFFERKLKTFATARNYNTMAKLLSLSAD